MRLRLTKQILSAFAALAFVTSAASVSAQVPNGSFIVASQVVSDSAAPASAYVGDLASETYSGEYSGDLASTTFSGDCANGNCGGGTCQGGSCGIGQGGSGGNGLFGGCNRNNSIGCQPRKYDRPDLFYNFYSQGNCNSANAQMYTSPGPVPPFVGHTFNTYQPFSPHEYMYWHKNRFHNQYDNGRGMNRTKAKYYAPPIKTAMKNIYWNKLRLPR